MAGNLLPMTLEPSDQWTPISHDVVISPTHTQAARKSNNFFRFKMEFNTADIIPRQYVWREEKRNAILSEVWNALPPAIQRLWDVNMADEPKRQNALGCLRLKFNDDDVKGKLPNMDAPDYNRRIREIFTVVAGEGVRSKRKQKHADRASSSLQPEASRKLTSSSSKKVSGKSRSSKSRKNSRAPKRTRVAHSNASRQATSSSSASGAVLTPQQLASSSTFTIFPLDPAPFTDASVSLALPPNLSASDVPQPTSYLAFPIDVQLPADHLHHEATTTLRFDSAYLSNQTNYDYHLWSDVVLEAGNLQPNQGFPWTSGPTFDMNSLAAPQMPLAYTFPQLDLLGGHGHISDSGYSFYNPSGIGGNSIGPDNSFNNANLNSSNDLQFHSGTSSYYVPATTSSTVSSVHMAHPPATCSSNMSYSDAQAYTTSDDTRAMPSTSSLPASVFIPTLPPTPSLSFARRASPGSTFVSSPGSWTLESPAVSSPVELGPNTVSTHVPMPGDIVEWGHGPAEYLTGMGGQLFFQTA